MRLIDADALVKELTRPTGLYADCERCSWSISNECMDCIVEDVIKHIPTIDPVKHGEWISCQKPNHLWDIIVFKCSICGCENYNDSLYCPCCGAKMDGDSNG